jgi:hypothetical protein
LQCGLIEFTSLNMPLGFMGAQVAKICEISAV